jgi:hypothetical protein
MPSSAVRYVNRAEVTTLLRSGAGPQHNSYPRSHRFKAYHVWRRVGGHGCSLQGVQCPSVACTESSQELMIGMECCPEPAPHGARTKGVNAVCKQENMQQWTLL